MRLVVARVGRPHGIRGEVTVEVRTDAPGERFVPGAVLDVTAPGRCAPRGRAQWQGRGRGPGKGTARQAAAGPGATKTGATGPGATGLALPGSLTLTGARDHNGILLLTFAEVVDRTMAEALRGALLEAEVPDSSEESDAWYDHQLVGLRAEAPDGTVLGQVVDVEHAPAQDLLVVRRHNGERRLVPFVGAIVPTVDVDGGRLVVVDPGGLLADLDNS
jgi:16S rRNA processing protein RimM